MGKKRIIVYIACLAAMLFWSLSFIWYKDVYVYFTPFTTVFLRLVISAILLFSAALVFNRLQKIRKADYLNIFLLSLFEPLLYFVGESLGMLYVPATTASVIISMIPLLVPIAAYYFLKERLLIKNIIGIVISCVGVVLVVLNGEFEFSVSLKGLLLLSISVVAAVFYSVTLKKLADVYNPLTLIAWQNSFGVLTFLPLVLIFEPHGLHAGLFALEPMIPLLKLAIFASSGAFILYAFAVKHLGAVKANIFTNLIPVLTALLSFLLLNERLHMHNIIGIAVVIGGLILSQLNPRMLNNKLIKRVSRREK
jgi:drug/metabolite transporter (DMT)-like permease